MKMRTITKQLTPASGYSVVFIDNARVQVRPVLMWALVERWFTVAEDGADACEDESTPDTAIEPVFEYDAMLFPACEVEDLGATLVANSEIDDEVARTTALAAKAGRVLL